MINQIVKWSMKRVLPFGLLGVLLTGCGGCRPTPDPKKPADCSMLMNLKTEGDTAYVGVPFPVSNHSDFDSISVISSNSEQKKISLDDDVVFSWDFGDGKTEPEGASSLNHVYDKEGKATITLSCPCGKVEKEITIVPAKNPKPCTDCAPLEGKIQIKPEKKVYYLGDQITLTETNLNTTSWVWNENLKLIGNTRTITYKLNEARTYTFNCKINDGIGKIVHPEALIIKAIKPPPPPIPGVQLPEREIVAREADTKKLLESGVSDFPALKKIKDDYSVLIAGKKISHPFFDEKISYSIKIRDGKKGVDYGKDLDEVVNNLSSMPLKNVIVDFATGKEKSKISSVTISGELK